jgi:16S rRNA (adenine1518-N6/adenine1519-N6)-dimethyltransferase
MSHRPQRPRYAKKELGQNFLTDPRVIERIVAELHITIDDTIIEIGPGRGALTEKLVATGARVIAIELDRDLVAELTDRFAEAPNFTVIEGDASTMDLREVVAETETRLRLGSISDKDARGPAKLAANLPYYISTAILQRLIEQRETFSELVLMFQKEVVDRITAAPGNSERGFLTVLTEAAFDVTRLFDVPPKAFRPVPKVTSSVVRLIPKSASVADGAEFRKLVSAGFAQKRKTLLNNLKTSYPDAAKALDGSGVDPKRRAEGLTLEEWRRLLSSFR